MTVMEDLGIEDLYDETLPEALLNVRPWIGYLTPEGAAGYLKHNVEPEAGKKGSNRSWVAARVDSYATEMLAGRWKFNHQGIAFNTDGNLIDGQHRLRAVVKAGEADPDIQVPMVVWWDLPLDANIGIDRNMRRIGGDFLTMEGFSSGNRLSKTCALLWCFANNNFDEKIYPTFWSQTLEPTVLLATAAEWPDLQESSRIGGRLAKILVPSGTAAGWLVARRAFPDVDMDEFVNTVQHGAMLAIGDPRLALRTWGLNRRDGKKKGEAYESFGVFLKTFAAWRQGRTDVEVMVLRGNEKFPRP